MNRTMGTLALGVLTGAALLGLGRSARAQQWEVELHGGGLLSGTPRDGQSQMPPGAGTVATLGGGTSPRVTSWYLGDGSSLLNQVSAFLQGPQLTPLDPVLRAPALERRNGGNVGLRLGRRLNRRLTLEASFDYNFARLELSPETLAGIEASRASFIRAWSQPLFFNPSVRSDATIDARGGRQFLVTGALNVNLVTGRRFEPYLTFGGGFVSSQANALAATLEGSYQIRIAVPPPISVTLPFDETDRVALRFSRESSFLGLLGLGFKYRFSERWGVRLDIREHLSANRTHTRLDATPSAAVLAPFAALSFQSSPGLQFINNPAAFRTESTLSGPAIAGFETFKGTGLQSQLGISAGLFLRF